MTGSGRPPSLSTQGWLVDRKVSWGPGGGPTVLTPSHCPPCLPVISYRENPKSPGIPTGLRGRGRASGNQKPGLGPSCVTPESWRRWLRDQATGASQDSWGQKKAAQVSPLLSELPGPRPGSRMMSGPGPCRVIPFTKKPPSFPCSTGTTPALTLGPVA